MGATAFWAPVHRALGRLAGAGAAAFPPDAAPSLTFLGEGIQDHRLAYDRFNSATGAGILGHYGARVLCLNAAPATKGAAKLAALANVVNGAAMALAAASTGITVMPANTVFFPSMVTLSAGLVIDGLPALKRFGRHFVTAFYDRTTLGGRAVSVTGVVNGAGGDFLISGYDVYGYAMSEKITAGAGVNTVNGKKAFKVVTSIVPQFTDAHNYSVGTLDIFGLPVRSAQFADTLIHWNDALITANTGFVVADATSPATTTTGDVRGTYATQDASDGAKRLVMRIDPSLALINTNPTTGLFGVAQV